jgi:hypothetical protein
MRTLVGSLTVGVAVATAPPALAQSMPRDPAEELFQRGLAEMAAGNIDKACATFEVVWRVDRGGGTIVALAICHEKQGRGATALAEFRQARELATTARRDDRVHLADEHIAQLEPTVSRLTVETATAREPGLRLELDGAVLAPVNWDIAIAVDAGEHTVRASVPDRPAWEVRIHVAASGDRLRVELPGWSASPPAPQQASTPRETAPSGPHVSAEGRGRRGAGVLLVGAGVAALGVGGYFGLVAFLKRHDALSACDGSTDCVSGQGYLRAVGEDHRSDQAAFVSTVTIAAGAGVVAAGIVLLVTGRSSTAPRSARVAAAPLPGGGALSLRASF